MLSIIHGISHLDSQDIAGPICHPPVVTALFSSISGVAEVVVNLILQSESLHVLTVHYKVL
jgi:hypothetical protein